MVMSFRTKHINEKEKNGASTVEWLIIYAIKSKSVDIINDCLEQFLFIALQDEDRIEIEIEIVSDRCLFYKKPCSVYIVLSKDEVL